MSGLELLIAAGSLLGTALEALAQAAWWVLRKTFKAAVFVAFVIWCTSSRTARRAEYHTRPD